MKTILQILEKAGVFRPTLYLKIENPAYMALVIEEMPEPGPLGLPGLSLLHYGRQNGDPMRDQEMCFELGSPSATISFLITITSVTITWGQSSGPATL